MTTSILSHRWLLDASLVSDAAVLRRITAWAQLMAAGLTTVRLTVLGNDMCLHIAR